MKTIYTHFVNSFSFGVIFLLLVFGASFGTAAQTSYIYVYSPFSGEVTYRNSGVNITWYSSGADTVNLSYSLDGGITWNGVASNHVGFDYAWTTPDTVSNTCVIRVSSVADSTVFGESGTFVISGIPTLALTTPNGGETWNYNELATVSWTGTNLPYYLYMDYSIDGGLTWNQLGSGYSDSTGGTTQVYVPYVSSSNALVKIYDPYHSEMISDSSNQPFTIISPPVIVYSPYEGDQFYIRQETYLSWMAAGGISLVNIDLTTDGGLSWQPVAQNLDASYGYYQWTIAGAPSNACKIRISDASDPAAYGLSSTFSLLPTPVITLHTPSGGEILNTNAPYVISWSYDNPSAYYVYLEYSSDNGQNWNYIDYVLNPGSAGNYQWTSPAVESDQYLVRVSDYNLDFVADTSNAFSVISYPETPICMVTVDSATNRNLIVWEKPVSPLIDHFVVYKESGVAGVYESIGSVSYDSLSTFTDQNSNPAIKSYRYKLGFNDAAGHVFPSGNLHQTIHLSINKGVGDAWNLIWTDYMGFTVGSYNIYRGTSPADMSLITSISASFNSFTDIEAPAGSIYYVVEVVNPNGCIPTVKSNTYSNSRSNIATNKNLGVNTIKDGMRVSVYPNPVSEDIHVDITGPGLQPSIVLELRDLLGRVVYSGIAMQTEALNKHVVNVRDLREGVYMLVVVSGERQSVNKIIIRR